MRVVEVRTDRGRSINRGRKRFGADSQGRHSQRLHSSSPNTFIPAIQVLNVVSKKSRLDQLLVSLSIQSLPCVYVVANADSRLLRVDTIKVYLSGYLNLYRSRAAPQTILNDS